MPTVETKISLNILKSLGQTPYMPPTKTEILKQSTDNQRMRIQTIS